MRRAGLASLLLAPIVLVNALAALAPLADLAVLSLRRSLPGGAVGPGLGPTTWIAMARDPASALLVAGSLGVALLVTLLTLLCAYPLALFAHRAAPRWRRVLVVLCVAPLLVSVLARIQGALILLGDSGFVAAVLRLFGATEPTRLTNHLAGVVIGLVQILMPTMILCLLMGMRRLSPTIENAAASLGASRWWVFRRVVWPLSLPGVLLGCLFSFVFAIGNFILPTLLGGERVNLLAPAIYGQAMVTRNWPAASALSMLTLGICGLALLLYARLLRMAE